MRRRWNGSAPDPLTLARAITQRKSLTIAEVALWSRIRNYQLAGAYFRRQVPIGSFIADFACKKLRLVVEVDGDSHELTVLHDERRTAFLERKGYSVVRFTNEEVLEDSDTVVARLALLVRDRASHLARSTDEHAV